MKEGGEKAAAGIVACCSCLCALACMSIPITQIVIILGTWDDLKDPITLAQQDMLKTLVFIGFGMVGGICLGACCGAFVHPIAGALCMVLVACAALSQVVIFWILATPVLKMEEDGNDYDSDGGFKTFVIKFTFWVQIVYQVMVVISCCCSIVQCALMGPAVFMASMQERASYNRMEGGDAKGDDDFQTI